MLALELIAEQAGRNIAVHGCPSRLPIGRLAVYIPEEARLPLLVIQ